jgi:hypothetical protein
MRAEEVLCDPRAQQFIVPGYHDFILLIWLSSAHVRRTRVFGYGKDQSTALMTDVQGHNKLRKIDHPVPARSEFLSVHVQCITQLCR